jgi:hypothetical protein
MTNNNDLDQCLKDAGFTVQRGETTGLTYDVTAVSVDGFIWKTRLDNIEKWARTFGFTLANYVIVASLERPGQLLVNFTFTSN